MCSVSNTHTVLELSAAARVLQLVVGSETERLCQRTYSGCSKQRICFVKHVLGVRKKEYNENPKSCPNYNDDNKFNNHFEKQKYELINKYIYIYIYICIYTYIYIYLFIHLCLISYLLLYLLYIQSDGNTYAIHICSLVVASTSHVFNFFIETLMFDCRFFLPFEDSRSHHLDFLGRRLSTSWHQGGGCWSLGICTKTQGANNY